MKRIQPIIAAVCVILAVSLFTSCEKENNTGTNNNKPKDTIVPVKVVLEDTITQFWIVTKATHNGSADPSSMGLKIDMHENGTYDLVGKAYSGTWEFIENKTKVLIDKNDANYKTTWTIVKLSSKHMEITFKSPFTGGAVEWTLDVQ